LFFCHFLLAQKVTKKGTTKTNHLLVLVAQGYTPGLAELVVRTFRGHPARLHLLLFRPELIEGLHPDFIEGSKGD
jgi:hypothetical protein